MSARLPIFAAGFLIAAAALAQAPTITVGELTCLPRKENAVLTATLTPDLADGEARLYFQRDEYGDAYYVALEKSAEGSYWAVFPKPDNENHAVTYYLEARDGVGQVVARTEPVSAPVKDDDDCPGRLNSEQRDKADDLTVGETAYDQRGQWVAWFLCDGITQRIDLEGVRRPEEFCGIPPSPVPVRDHGLIIDPEPLPAISPARPGSGGR